MAPEDNIVLEYSIALAQEEPPTVIPFGETTVNSQ